MATSNSQLATAILAAIGSTHLANYVNANFHGPNGSTPSLNDCVANVSCTLAQVQNAFVLAVAASQYYYHFANTNSFFVSNTLNTAATIAAALAATPHHRIGNTLNSLT